MADALLLSSQRVLPQRLQMFDYHFQYPDLSAALKNILKQN
jgi:NAD dependent epimerase/dehydratase family enzyme